LENFEASADLVAYGVRGDRWVPRHDRQNLPVGETKAKLIPQRAARLDLRSLMQLNYSAAGREQAGAEVEHLRFIRGEVVRQIYLRRQPLVADRDLAREMVDTLEDTQTTEISKRMHEGKDMPVSKYEPYQMRSLEASAKTLRDSKLLQEIHEWEKNASKNDPEINWDGRAVAREIMSGIAVGETKERLLDFLESKKVASLHLGNHRTGTLREVEARTVTEYLARAIESIEQRDFRHTKSWLRVNIMAAWLANLKRRRIITKPLTSSLRKQKTESRTLQTRRRSIWRSMPSG
jgi:hypothetical protein